MKSAGLPLGGFLPFFGGIIIGMNVGGTEGESRCDVSYARVREARVRVEKTCCPEKKYLHLRTIIVFSTLVFVMTKLVVV